MKIEIRDKSLSPKRSAEKIKKEDVKLPMIMRFRSAKKSKEEEEREYKLIKNSHILLSSESPTKTNKIRSRSAISEYPKDIM